MRKSGRCTRKKEKRLYREEKKIRRARIRRQVKDGNCQTPGGGVGVTFKKERKTPPIFYRRNGVKVEKGGRR